MLTVREQMPSGQHHQFLEAHLSFTDYINTLRQRINHSRVDITAENQTTIINANAPFEYRPDNFDGQHGVLLVHGLFASPLCMQTIAKQLCQQGMLSRAILLPGHGTVPGDLLGIQLEEWLKAVQYGIDSLKNDVKYIHYVGFSLGGLLGIYQALRKEPLHSLLCIAPACQLNSTISLANHAFHVANLMTQQEQWYYEQHPTDYARYFSVPMNTAWQVKRLIRRVHELLMHHRIDIAMAMILTEDDETTDASAALNLFEKHTHPANQLLYYSRENPGFDDKRMHWRSSAYVEKKILDFSHICLNFSEDDSHYGQHGDFTDTVIEQPKALDDSVYLGALSKRNLKQYHLRRLTYNPDFAYTMDFIKAFFAAI